ncbi:HotDog domain-containing protein [Hypomontagnella submonticulosa]|nr:HotDog domain-containing protein [Hypomontagnella submonticulosa]
MPARGFQTARLCLRAATSQPRLAQANPAIQLRRAAPTQLLPLRSSRLYSISQRPSEDEPLRGRDRDQDQDQDQDPIAIATTYPSRTPSQPLDTTESQPRHRSRGVYYSAVFLLLGLCLGTAARFAIVPPEPITPGSDQDRFELSRIRAAGAQLPLVRALSEDPAWRSWDAYSGSQTADMVRSRITSGPLGWSHGLAFQRIFHNPATGEVVTVVYFGPATSGWPGVVHGGALATVLDESLGRAAILRFPARTGVTARLELQYRAPTLTAGYYVVRSRPLVREDDDPAKADRKMWVEGTLENEKGKVCVEAKALYVVPKGVKLEPLVEKF